MTSTAKNLEEAIRHSGEGWLIDSFVSPDQGITYLHQRIAEVNARSKQRLGGNAPDLSEDALVETYNRYPLKVKGFFQVLGGARTPDMLLMAWRIIQGMEIKEVNVTYHRQKEFRLHVILESPYGDEDEEYTSSTIQDFVLFRHIGIMEISGLPVFDGFYALKLKEK